MQIETHGQQIDVTPALRDYVENRFSRLGRHFEHPCQIRVQLGLDKPQHRAEATVTMTGRSLHAGHIVCRHAAPGKGFLVHLDGGAVEFHRAHQ